MINCGEHSALAMLALVPNVVEVLDEALRLELGRGVDLRVELGLFWIKLDVHGAQV